MILILATLKKTALPYKVSFYIPNLGHFFFLLMHTYMIIYGFTKITLGIQGDTNTGTH